MALLDEGRRQVERGGRLRHAALLVGERDDLGLAGHGETPRVGWENHRPPIRVAAAFSCPAPTTRGTAPATMGGAMKWLPPRGRVLPDRPDPRRDGELPREPRGPVAAVLLRARRRDRARARGAHAGCAGRLRRRARVDAADRGGHGPGADQRAADPGDHGADDGPAAGPRRAAADRVRRLPRAAARPLRGHARGLHLRDPRRARRVHRLLRDADRLAGDRPPGRGRGRRGHGGGPGAVGDLLQRGPGRRVPARARRLAGDRGGGRTRGPGGGGARRPPPLRPARGRRRRAARDRDPALRHRVVAAARGHRVARPRLAAVAPGQQRVQARARARRAARVRRADGRPAERRRAGAHPAPGAARRPARGGRDVDARRRGRPRAARDVPARAAPPAGAPVGARGRPS